MATRKTTAKATPKTTAKATTKAPVTKEVEEIVIDPVVVEEVVEEVTIDPVIVEEIGEVTTDPVVDEEVTIEPVVITQAPEPKNVKIKMAQNHNCVIGGVRYTLAKGTQYNVPVNVKNILSREGLLLPL